MSKNIMLPEMDFEEEGELACENASLSWGSPIPFNAISTPDIPASLLPGWLGDYADAVSKMVKTPSCLSVLMGLSVVSTCLQKRYRVSVHEGYSEPMNIWTVSVLPPATRKTAVVSAMTSVLLDWEREEAERLCEEIEENKATRTMNLRRMDYLNNKAAKQDNSIDRQILIKEIADLRKETPEEMRAPRLWTGDVTPERLENLMVEHREAMSLISDEGGIFEVMGGLYASGHANIDVFLKGHSGSPVRVDRGQREAFLREPALTFGLTCQPEVISDLAVGSKRKFRGQGVLARFLYATPASNVGYRDVSKIVPIPAKISQAYKAGIRSLLKIPKLKGDDGQDQPQRLGLMQNAYQSWQKFAEYIEANQGPRKEFETLQDWTGKLPGAALRIAGLCHVIERPESDVSINEETMGRALDLCQLLIPHAQCAFDLLGDDRPIANAKYLLRWITQERKPFFNQRDCHRANRGRIQRAEGIREALAVLTERNLISEGEVESRGGPGRPSIWFHVNPVVLSGVE